MITTKIIARLAAAAAVGLSAMLASAGPEDQFSKYYVTMGLYAGVQVRGVADTGGTTTISFADAKRMGILDANGDPTEDPDGTQNLGGTGGASVKCHIFRNVFMSVQPRNADGTPNGPARTVKVTVFVPKKPSEQTGANDAEKQKKTNSVPTKAGANICGADIEGHKLDFTDKATNDPKKNKRSTGWCKIDATGGSGTTGGADGHAPAQEDDNFEDEFIYETFLPHAWINGQPTGALLNTAPVTAMGAVAAQQFGVFPIADEVLDFENHQILFMAGLMDTLPDADNELILPIGQCMIEIPTVEGGVIALAPVSTFLLPEGDPLAICIGANGLVPAGTCGWMDNESDLFAWDFDLPCVADFNGDGVVNTLDVLDFLNAWSAGDTSADINGDGLINTLDVLAFLNAWSAGCD